MQENDSRHPRGRPTGTAVVEAAFEAEFWWKLLKPALYPWGDRGECGRVGFFVTRCGKGHNLVEPGPHSHEGSAQTRHHSINHSRVAMELVFEIRSDVNFRNSESKV